LIKSNVKIIIKLSFKFLVRIISSCIIALKSCEEVMAMENGILSVKTVDDCVAVLDEEAKRVKAGDAPNELLVSQLSERFGFTPKLVIAFKEELDRVESWRD